MRAKAGGSRRRSSGPVRLDRLARDALGRTVSRFGFGSAEILAAWPEIVGPALAARTRPERIRWPRRRDEGSAGEAATLVIRAEGGDALEIQHAAPQILERVNAFFGWGAIGRIAIRQAPVAGAEPEAPKRPSQAARAPDVSGIEDDELRRAFERLGRHIAAEEDNST